MNSTANFLTKEQAINIFKEIEQKKSAIILNTIDFADVSIVKEKKINVKEALDLIILAKSIVYYEDEYFKNMELYSIFQNSLENIKKKGMTNNLIWV